MAESHFMEWGEFAPKYLTPAPDRRVGKRWIATGEIPGKILDGKPYVDVGRFLDPANDPDPIEDEDYKFLYT